MRETVGRSLSGQFCVKSCQESGPARLIPASLASTVHRESPSESKEKAPKSDLRTLELSSCFVSWWVEFELVEYAHRHSGNLLEFDSRALLFELLLELLGVGLFEAFLDGLGGAFDQVLGFLEAQAGRGADNLDDLNLLVARGLEDDVERCLLGFLLGRGRGTAAATTAAIITAARGGFDAVFSLR